MSTREKRAQKVFDSVNGGSLVSWEELTSFLKGLGFKCDTSSGGSHHSFHNAQTGDVIYQVVKPHPHNEVKKHTVKKVLKYLEERGYMPSAPER